jgi:hypothetical protein
VLESHLRLGFKANAGTEDVCQSSSLLGESIDYRCARWGERSLEHVAEDAEDAMEILEVLGSQTIRGLGLPLDAAHHFSHENQVNDEGGSEKRVFTDIE